MAPVFVDLCAGLVMLLPRQIRRFRHGFFSSAVPRLKLEELSSREAPLKAANRGQSTVSSSIFPTWTSSLRSQISLSKRREGYYGKPLDEAVSNFFFEPSLSEKFGLWRIPIGNHIHLNLTSMCGFSLNPPPPPNNINTAHRGRFSSECEPNWRLQIKWRPSSSVFALGLSCFFLVKFVAFAMDSFRQLS